MKDKNPYHIIKSRYVTEKALMLQELQSKETGSPSLKKCKSPKYVFLVDKNANKKEIASAVEYIYADSKIKVVSVNTIHAPEKPKWVRGRLGIKSGFKKAIVTLAAGDEIPENV